tara:strand:+ start:103 stop:840 length:738 start_codon:yes stop_codon:yes gene_type:complete
MRINVNEMVLFSDFNEFKSYAEEQLKVQERRHLLESIKGVTLEVDDREEKSTEEDQPQRKKRKRKSSKSPSSQGEDAPEGAAQKKRPKRIVRNETMSSQGRAPGYEASRTNKRRSDILSVFSTENAAPNVAIAANALMALANDTTAETTTKKQTQQQKKNDAVHDEGSQIENDTEPLVTEEVDSNSHAVCMSLSMGELEEPPSFEWEHGESVPSSPTDSVSCLVKGISTIIDDDDDDDDYEEVGV